MRATLAALGLLLIAAPAGAWQFVNVIDSDGIYSEFTPPGIDSSGRVATRARFDGGGQAILAGTAYGGVSQIATTAGPFSAFLTQVSLGDSGAVLFNAELDAGGTGVFVGPDPVADVVATSTDGTFFFVSPSAIDAAGTVVLYAGLQTTGFGGFYVGTDALVDNGGDFDVFGRPAVNDTGTVAFQAGLDDNAGSGVYTVPLGGGAASVVAESDGPYAGFNERVAINDAGGVAFVATLDAGASGVFTGPNPATDTVVDTSGPFDLLDDPAIAETGVVIFSGATATSGGIFTGPDPVADKVIASFDPLFGSTVAGVNMRSEGYENGRLAFSYTLADGRQGVAIAYAPEAGGAAGLVAALLTLIALSAPARAVPYSFRNAADQTGPYTNFGGAPVINDDGDVAFEATLDDGTEGIFTGPDPGTDTIADDSGPFDVPIDLPSINAEGTVAFRAWLDPDDQHFFGLRGIFDGPDPDADRVADEDDARFAAGLNSPSIADDGKIAFDAIDNFGNFAIYTADDAGVELVADDGGPLTVLFASAINDAGTTVAFYADLDAGGGGIFTGDDLPDDRVADSSGVYFQFDIPAVNDENTVIFRATLDGTTGGEGIFSGPDSTADRIVDTAGPYADFAGYAINDEGTVVFGAGLDAGGLGIFTGPSPTADKVIRTGDALFGSTVTFVSLSRENLNDNGEVAFLYELANGRTGVAVASPGAIERSFDGGDSYEGVRVVSAAGEGTIARLRDGTAGGDRTLALSFRAGLAQGGDLFELLGSEDDEIVVELEYDDAGVANEAGLLLHWRDPADGVWKHAVLGNTPPGVAPPALGMSFDEYRSQLGAPPQLGAHGNDPDSNTVWAIVDHGGRFAVPEPARAAASSFALLALAALAGGGRLRRPLSPRVRARSR